MNTLIKLLPLAIAITLSGCSGESGEAKSLGFSSVEEMKEIHQLGWHSKTQYLQHIAKQRGFASVSEMQNADEQEKLRIEARKKAEQEELSRPWQSGIRYQYFSDGSCKSDGKNICLTPISFKRACGEVTGVSQDAISTLAANSYGDEKTLLEGGHIVNEKINYGTNSKGANVCTVRVVLEGLVKGSSTRMEFSGNAKMFKADSKGKLSISYFSF